MGAISITVTSQPRARGAGRQLEPDEAAADDDDVTAAGQPGSDLLGVGHRSQDERLVAAGDGQRPRPRAGGQQEPVEGQRAAVGQRDGAAMAVDGGGGDPGQHVDVELGQAAVGEQRGRSRGLLGRDRGFRQRRSFVRRVRLVAHERDRAVVSGLPERLRRPTSADARADDDDPLDLRRHAVVQPRSMNTVPSSTFTG